MLTKEEMQALADREKPRIRRIDSVKTITVIAVETLVGEGVEGDAARRAHALLLARRRVLGGKRSICRVKERSNSGMH